MGLILRIAQASWSPKATGSPRTRLASAFAAVGVDSSGANYIVRDLAIPVGKSQAKAVARSFLGTVLRRYRISK